MRQNHIIIGLGGVGGRSIAAIRKAIYVTRKADIDYIEKEGANFSFLYIDSNDDVLCSKCLWCSAGKSYELNPDETIKLKEGYSVKERGNIANHEKHPGIKEWLGNIEDKFAKKRNIAKAQATTELFGLTGAAQLRRYGRLLFALNQDTIYTKLNDIFYNMAVGGTKKFCVHIFATLGGGTGSGSIVDIVTYVNGIYNELFGNLVGANQELNVNLYVFVAGKSAEEVDTGFFFLNEYAVLRDLNGLMIDQYHPHLTRQLGNKNAGDRFSCETPIHMVYLSSDMSPLSASIDEQVNYIAEACVDAIIYRNRIPNPNGIKAITGEDLIQSNPGDNGKRNLGIAPLRHSYRFAALGTRRWRVPTKQMRDLLRYDIEKIITTKWLIGTEDGNGFKNCTLEGTFATDYQAGEAWKKITETSQKYLDDLTTACQKLKDGNKYNPDTLSQISKICNDIRQKINLKVFEDKVLYHTDAQNYASDIAKRLDSKLVWNIGGAVWGLNHVSYALTRLIQDYASKLEKIIVPQNTPQQIEEIAQCMAAREKEWPKMSLLTILFTKKDDKMFKAHVEDAQTMIRLTMEPLIRQIEKSICQVYQQKLLDLRERVQRLIWALEKHCQETEIKYNQLAAELQNIAQSKDSNIGIKYEFDSDNLRAMQERIEGDTLTQQEEMATTYQTIWNKEISSLDEVDDTKTQNLLGSIGDVIYNTVTNLHGKAVNTHKLSPVLFGSIMERLYQIAGPNDQKWEENLKDQIIDFLAVNKLGCSSNIKDGVALKKLQTSPVKGLAIGYPDPKKSNVPANFVEWFKEQIMKSIPADLGLNQDRIFDYTHESTEEIRILYTPYWMPAKCAPVVDLVFDEYLKVLQRPDGKLKAYFANIDEEDPMFDESRPYLTAEGMPDSDSQRRTECARRIYYSTSKGKRPIVIKEKGKLRFLKPTKAGTVEYTDPYPELQILYPTDSYREALDHAISTAVKSLTDEQKQEICAPIQKEIESLENQLYEKSGKVEELDERQVFLKQLKKELEIKE